MILVRNLMDDDDDLDGNDMATTTSATPYHLVEKSQPTHLRSNPTCHAGYGCAPGLILTDSEDSSFASCGTDDFFDLEEISNTLNLIENWQKLHRRVKFGSARVQEYAITVGDHPICKDGLALSLDWAHSEEEVYDIDSYELRRQNSNRRRGMKRRRRVSKLDYWQRREILIRVSGMSNANLSRIECQRNQEAVSEFLRELGTDDYGQSQVEQEEEGIELEQVYYGTGADDTSSALLIDGGFGWQMNVQILEG